MRERITVNESAADRRGRVANGVLGTREMMGQMAGHRISSDGATVLIREHVRYCSTEIIFLFKSSETVSLNSADTREGSNTNSAWISPYTR